MIAINLSKNLALVADTRTIQQTNFTANSNRAENTAMFLSIGQEKETVLDFSQGSVKMLYNKRNFIE